MPRRSYKNSPGKKPSAAKRTGGKPKRGARKPKAKTSESEPKSQSAAPKKRPASKDTAGKRTTKRTAGKRTRRAPAAATTSTRDQPQRLQRLLAAAGFGSRRQCESLIEEGRVEVDGEIAAELGTVVDPKSSKVLVDGVPLRQQKLVYYAVNKPTGFLSTNADPRGRQRVIDLVPNSERVFPVGRLDQSSQGLMLLTNDGDLAQQLSHPKYGVRKVYRVTVAGKIDGETMRSMRKGIYISDGFVRVEGAKIVKSRARATEMEITLREGKNREIRRILARLGHKVQTLRRIAIGPLRIGDMPVGAHRVLSRDEVSRLRKAIEHSRDEVADETPRRRPAGKGTKKRSAKKKSAGKRRYAESRNDVTARRTSRKPATTKFSFKPKKSDGGGSIIGGD
ncbi:Ribosomal large subunit pseudouridine synthase B [Stieleria neptunia]|uniref:Pseudouridine synthase n=1 Tax=Stieleria neptunia TaxID=2527979 RepID=A0A518I011_9BACT|nr:pseudouridine synthase [Stieleria neptunia]QDV46456.1 Ribosomal large subunit pseudouridine synthase B [Stieleria neptunia]